MSDNYNAAVLVARLQEVADAIDAGPSNGFLRITDSSCNVLTSFQLSSPCGIVSAPGVLTFSGMSLIDPAAIATGMPRLARFETSDGTVVASGLTCGSTNGFEVVFSAATINAGDAVELSGAAITGN